MPPVPKLHIILVSQEYPPETARGGIGTQTKAKALGLTQRGHRVSVISRSTDSLRHEKSEDNLTVIRIPGMEDRFPEMTDSMQWLTHSLAVAAELTSLQQREAPDIIDFPEWGAEGYAYLLNRNERDRIPVVVQLHGPLVMFAQTMNWPDVHSPFYRTGIHMEATCVQLADAVYSSSQYSAGWIRKYYAPGLEKIPVIHLGVDTSLFRPISGNKKLDQPTIIFTGKIVPNKGALELVEAACRLASEFPGLRLIMAGHIEQGLLKQITGKVKEWGPLLQLEFPGYVQKESLPALLSRSDLFAAPSWFEGGPGFVYLEAMACGLPVIGCSGSGMDEIIHQGKNGMLVPPRDVNALASALRQILGDAQLRSRLGSGAREYAVAHADGNSCLEALESYYYSVIGARKANKVQP